MSIVGIYIRCRIIFVPVGVIFVPAIIFVPGTYSSMI